MAADGIGDVQPGARRKWRRTGVADLSVTAGVTSPTFRPDIEGLRGVAVLLVVACHCAIPWTTGGFIGVDVFFVLSGYLITGLLAAEQRAARRVDLVGFYARRARRLLPAGVLVLLATLAAALALLPPPELVSAGRAALAAALYVSNVFFDHGASDYFAPAVETNPLLHTWSLGVEEQFYLIWPLLLLFAARGQNGARRSLAVLGALALLSFACCALATRLAPTLAFYELPARAWEFAAGGLLALRARPVGARAAHGASAAGIGGLVLMLAAAVLLEGGAGFPGWRALVPVAGTLAVLHAGTAAPGRGVGRLLATAPLQFVGSRSYSWYLWHWPCIVFAGLLVPGIGVRGKVVAALVALLLATATYSLVERPVRFDARLVTRARLSLRLAAAAILCAAATAAALIAIGDVQATDAGWRALAAATTDIAELSHHDCVSAGRATEPVICEFGADATAPTLVLFGDSHALQWFNPLRRAATLERWHLVTLLKAGCPASDSNAHPVEASAGTCRTWRARAIERIGALHPAGVVLASYTGSTLRGFGAEARLSLEELRAGTRRTLEQLSRLAVPIVVLRDSPLPPYDLAVCVGRRGLAESAAGACDFDAAAAVNEPAFAAEREAAAGLPNVQFVDLSDLICPGRSCPALQHGLYVYRDDNHLTGSFAATLAPAFQARLFPLLPRAQLAAEQQVLDTAPVRRADPGALE